MARGPNVDMRWNGKELTGLFHDAAMRGLLMGGEHILGVSREIVPLDESPLMHSGAVSRDDRLLTVAISYDTSYAVEQHENPNIRHAPGRTWKYLERPFNEEADTARAILNNQMRKVAH